MKLKVSFFDYLNQKIMYIQDVNYYFGIKDDFNIESGDYELSKEEALNIARENDPEEYEVFINTSIEERLNKINKYDIEEIKEESSHGQFTLCLHPSRKCNLNCKYCFRESEYLGEEQLTFDVAKDAIDFFVDKYAPCASKYVVDLSGSGEPLLQIDLIKQIVDYCKNKRNEICKNIEVMFCTNLTLLTTEMVEYLDNEPSIILGTSIDGDQITNDINRVYANGKGTYNDIVKGLKMFKNKKLGLAVTITPLNQDVDLIYDYLYHLPNVDCVSMKFIRCYDGSKYDFDNFDVSYLSSRYEKLCDNIFSELEKGNFDYLEKLLKGADYFGGRIYSNLFKGTYKIYRCDAGKSRITVNSKGDIFACSVMYGNEDFEIGNIYSGINRKKQKRFEYVSVEDVANCQKCIIKNNCGGECYINSYLNNNDLYKPIKKMCLLKIKLNKLGIAFISKIRNENSLMYKRLIDFAFEIDRYEVSSLEIWAVMYYLKKLDVTADYDEVSEYLSRFNKGDLPNGMLDFLRKYNENISAYKIDISTDKENITFPTIAILNRINSQIYNYAVLNELRGNSLVFRTLTSDIKDDSVDFIQFIKKYSNIFIF